MALLLELLLTAALTLLAAFLLATFFAANEPHRGEPDRAAAAIAEEEERIIEVDDVKRGERAAAVSAPEAEGWVEVEKAPAVVVAKEEPECAPEPDDEAEGVPVKSAHTVCPGVGLEEEGVDVGGEKRSDLTAATGVVVEATPHVLAAEAAPTPREEVLDVVGRVQSAGAKHYDTAAEAAPIQVLAAQPEKQGSQALPTNLEPVKPERRHPVNEVSPSAEAADAGMEESARAIEVTPDELAAETAPGEIHDQIVEAKGNESTADAVPQAAHHVPLAEEDLKVQQLIEELQVQQPVEELKVQQPVDNEAVHTCEEVLSREEAECETPPVDQKEELVPEEESVATKNDVVEASHEGISSDIAEVVTLQGSPEDDTVSDMDFGEWEGIERSEVEKRFGAAAAFAASEAGAAALSKLDSDVQLQLQGLLKVAIDGPCYGSTQPLTLRPSSRAKWVAWQKLGNMHPEIAMEKYMNILSEAIPGCLGNETADTKKYETGDDSVGTVLTNAATIDQRSDQGTEEDTGIIDEGHLTASPNPEKGQGSSIPAE